MTATNKQSAPGRVLAWTTAWVVLALLGIYLLINGGQTFISDGEVMLLTTMRIADYQTLTLHPDPAANFPQVVQGQGGFYFSRYGIGQPIAAAVLYLFGTHVVGMGLGAEEPFIVGRFFALLLPAFATACTAGLLCLWAARLYADVRLGAALALIYGVGTLALPYSRFFFSEPLFTCCLVFAAYTIYERRPMPGGVALGYALATRIAGVFVLPAFVLYAWLRGVRWPGLIGMGISMIPGGLLILLNNWVRFRSWYEQGYDGEGFTGNLLEGLIGLLFSPGKSVFLYVPLLLMLPFALAPFARRFRAEAIFIGALTATTLIQSALWWTWWAGWGWGPRFLVPLMPFLVLMTGVLLQRRGWRAVLVLVLLPLSAGVNLLGVLVDFNHYLSEITQGDMTREAIYLWQPAYSPIVAHIRQLDMQQLPIVSFQLSRSDIGFPEPAATVLSIAMVLLILGSLLGLWRTLRQSGSSGRAAHADQGTAHS